MNNQSIPKTFIFNEKIDQEDLYNLYADDFEYIEEMFSTTLQHFDPDFEAMQIAYAAGDVTDLKKATHKIKPTFGYVGLPMVQELCRAFEDLCQKVMTTNELTDDFKQIVATLADSKKLLETEYRRLKEFNANNPI